ncbi:uncharacterized protein LOC124266042 [Haliotis rubra]|uniref:uncharacterized protein LOC124266042 n=1 Tax=Haliotis rubra TaxID=36100 RepID=UPI001EE58F48|nr:uncharacterized protein LOC124266042 [Haliotis rubra]
MAVTDNIAASNFTSGDNKSYTITGQASWVTDGVTSGPCASVSSLYPAWEAEFTQSRTVTRIKIFWEDQQDDIHVSVDGRICHIANSSYMWEAEYTLECDVPLTGIHLRIYRQPTASMLNLSFCEVEIYADPIVTSSTMSTMSNTGESTTTTTSITTTKPTTSSQTSTAAPVPTETSTTSQTKPTTQPAVADTGTMIGAVVGVVVLLLIIVVVAVVCRNGIKKRYNPKDAEARAAVRNQAIKMDEVEQPNSTVFDLNEFKSVALPTYPEEKSASLNGSLQSHIPSAVSVANLPSYIREKLDANNATEYAASTFPVSSYGYTRQFRY